MPTSPYGRIAYAHGVWALPIHGIASRSLWATIITVMIIAGGAIMAGVCDTPVRGVIMGFMAGIVAAYAIRPCAA